MEFTKMHGLGNDYIYINALNGPILQAGALAIEMSNRHFGIGADGLVLIEPSTLGDYKMTMFNADGSEGEMCGNAARCIGKYVYEKKMTEKTLLSLETKSGLKEVILHLRPEDPQKVDTVTVDMGAPAFQPEKIPVNMEGDAVVDYFIQAEGKKWKMACVNMGNPHAVFFVNQPVEEVEVEHWGPYFETHELFPQKTNVEFAQIIDRNHIKMRVWERGSGETLACGTGAAAVLVAAAIQGLADREAVIELQGGNLKVKWRAQDNHVLQTGPASFVFEGRWLGIGSM
ncbi:MAG: diaminopimelate epimerase [Clostridiales bacterium]|nr:diaminopimelate epimerase [Clostridiales bacterium]